MAATIEKPNLSTGGCKQDYNKSGNLAAKLKMMALSSSTNASLAREGEQKHPMALLKKKPSFRGIAAGLMTMRLFTKHQLKVVETKPKVMLENTYKIDPDEGTLFKAKNVEKFVTDILEDKLRNEKYNQERCKKLSCDLSFQIKNSVKKMGFPRYKIICNVLIGQCMGQGVEMASQSIWSSNTDNFSCSSYKNGSLFAVATVHAVYFE